MNNDIEYIKNTVCNVRKRIEKAANKSGRKASDIKLVAVTKTIEPERIIKVIDEGVCDVGENRAQEMCEKFNLVDRKCSWHYIGHLQKNKVKNIIDKVYLIHSVDTLELAEEIQKRAEKVSRVIDVLVQVNIAEEQSKFGISKQQTPKFIKYMANYRNIKVRGLMTIAPYVQNPEEVRGVFRELNKIYIDIGKENIDNISMDMLSMGMSNDFEVAVEEGANVVRVGTAIFGRRF